MNNRFKQVTILVIFFLGLYNLLATEDDTNIIEQKTTIVSYKKANLIQNQPELIAKPQIVQPDQISTNPDEDQITRYPESVSLVLTDVFSSSNLFVTSFNGELYVSESSIESLSFYINNKFYEIPLVNINNNTFEYELDGEIISGMAYQTDLSQYIISFVNGPLEGIKLEFKTELNLSDSDRVNLSYSFNDPE